jgi:hypothetical protein
MQEKFRLFISASAYKMFLFSGYVNEKSLEPASLIIINGIVELVQVCFLNSISRGLRFKWLVS